MQLQVAACSNKRRTLRLRPILAINKAEKCHHTRVQMTSLKSMRESLLAAMFVSESYRKAAYFQYFLLTCIKTCTHIQC